MCNVHFILTLTPSMTAGQCHEILRFCELFLLMGSSLCSLLLRNYSTDFSNDDTNQLREQCRCATCTSFWPWPPPWLQVKVTKYFNFVNYFSWWVPVCVHFSSETTRPISPMIIPINWGNNVDVQRALHFDLDPLHDCRSRSRNTSIFVNYICWRVVVCVRFSSETTQPISPMMIPINWGNNVDVQHALHFDLDPSMTAGQGREILRFCEFRLLPWHECWYMSGPYKVAGDRLDLVTKWFCWL